MLDSIIVSETTGLLSVGGFIICLLAALVLGAAFTAVYRFCGETTKSFAVTLAVLPAIVSAVITMVSGSLGAGVAVAGTFSLIRFRSAKGTARELAAVFTSMAICLACGMGYPLFALLFTVILCAAFVLYAKTGFGEKKSGSLQRSLKITVPEDLEYAGMFDDVLDKYAEKYELVQVKTTNLGSLNKLRYDVALREAGTEKAFIDELRCRNGNLEISLSARADEPSDL